MKLIDDGFRKILQIYPQQQTYPFERVLIFVNDRSNIGMTNLTIFRKLVLYVAVVILLIKAMAQASVDIAKVGKDFDELVINDEAALITKLKKGYHGYGLARPVAAVNKTLNVDLLFIINEFLGIDELTGQMQVTAVIVATWQDDLLRWNPNRYHNLKSIPMKAHDIFLPTIIRDGNGGVQASIFMTGDGQNDRDINSMVWVSHTGQVESRVVGPHLTSCTVRFFLLQFPFKVLLLLFLS